MHHPKLHPRYLAVVIMALFLVSCGVNGTNKEDVVADPKAMDKSVAENIGAFLEAASGNDGNLDDSIHLKMLNVLKEVYQDRDDRPLWSSTEKWQPFADSLYHFIEQAELQGLFPEDYHFSKLRLLKTRLDADSLSRMDAVLWTRADLLLTDGLVQVIKDLKVGRLRKDSVSLNKDSVLYEDFYVATLRSILKKKQFSTVLDALQPAHQGYWELKKGIRSFLDSMDRRVFTHIRYPFKRGDAKDSAFFIKLLQQRLAESKCIDLTDKLPDSVQLSLAIKRYQAKKGLKADGKYGKILVSTLNNNDVERLNSHRVCANVLACLVE